ncbi:MAG: hypothetical protein E4H36_13605 [Spirochaetales bacterium]|nr:MAG: hypothetical protein E4H36_13605 [Spirochaetales bacterium]
MISYICTNCGAEVKTDPAEATARCPYCGELSEIRLETPGIDAFNYLYGKSFDKDTGADIEDGLKQAAEWLEGLGFSGQITGLNKAINLSGAQIDDSDTFRLGRFTDLEELNLSDTGVTDKGLPALLALTRLRKFNLNGTVVGDAGMGFMSGFGCLEELNLENTNVSEKGIITLIPHPSLKTLTVDQHKIKMITIIKAGGSRLFQMEHTLKLAKNSLIDEDLGHLKDFPDIINLVLEDNLIQGEGLSHLVGLKKLRSIHLSRNRLTDESLSFLEPFRNIGYLYIGGMKLSESAVKKLKKTLRKVRILSY